MDANTEESRSLEAGQDFEVINIKDWKGVVALCMISIFLFFILYSIVRVPYGRWIAIGLPVGLFGLNFFTLYGDWLPFRRGPQVNTLTGITGTQIGQPLQEYGGIETRWVSFPRTMVRREIKSQSEGGFYWVLDFIFGTVTIPLQGKTWQWIDIKQDDLENPNGCIFYIGRVDGGDLQDPNILQFSGQLERQSKIISYVFTAMSKLEEQVANIAKVRNLDSEEMASHLQGIADKVKNVKILTRGGSSGSEIQTLGAEMG